MTLPTVLTCTNACCLHLFLFLYFVFISLFILSLPWVSEDSAAMMTRVATRVLFFVFSRFWGALCTTMISFF